MLVLSNGNWKRRFAIVIGNSIDIRYYSTLDKALEEAAWFATNSSKVRVYAWNRLHGSWNFCFLVG